MAKKISLGGNRLNHNQLKNQHNQHNCKNLKVHNEKQKQRLVHNDENEGKDDEKISFYLKLGKCKRFKYM